MREIANLAELKALVGQEVAVSDWTTITQEQVNQFAEATGDHQWIHVDPERSRRESPFGAPVAHGFLTLSLLPMMMASAIRMSDVKMGVNYGLNKVRFPAPVPVGSRVRARCKLLTVEDIEGGAQLTWQVTMEREGSDKPVCVAESIARRYT
ncbi:MaoC family dehydratase [Noviherbaspirillum pedocola]|uniref:MaoC family dehydratase n=1 Tax=Noviherbaspirillum pedocola TaxID=2801341 RepID=A0A934W772_9BURK|nr:MaoC family dehydratase [Noviherbaspirillum pedocola]MBK4734349.1 MaoC family dehydratase [Noviherbaspirillum pedocola]